MNKAGRPRGKRIPIVKRKTVRPDTPTPNDDRKGFYDGALQNRFHKRSSAEATETMRRVVRRLQAITLRAAGVPYAEIGRQLGISQRCAYEDVHQCGAEIEQISRETAEGIRDVQNAQLDAVTRQIWPILSGQIAVPTRKGKFSRGDESAEEAKAHLDSTEESLAALGVSTRAASDTDIADLKLKAADRIIRVSKRRSEINGTDMPVKIAHTDPSGTRPHSDMSDEDLNRELAALGVTNVLEAVVVEDEDDPNEPDA